MRLVYEACKTVKIPIVGLGGIEKPTDIVEYLLAGATAVEVGMAHFVDPRASERLVEGLESWCEKHKTLTISTLRGQLQR
jgi:dihydroorotate dehydrogenase (NAD+) catalytic subunit